jgi:hypothetical protein
VGLGRACRRGLTADSHRNSPGVILGAQVDSTQIDYGAAGAAGEITFSEPFAATPAIVSSAGVSNATETGFTIAGAADWIAIGPSTISRASV